MRKLAHFILKFPKSILLCIVILTAASVYPALNVRTDFNLEGFFPKNDPTINEYEAFTQEFGRDDNTILVGIERENLFSNETLLDIKAITDSLKKIPKVLDVQSLWTAREMDGTGSSLQFKNYLTRDKLNTTDLKEVKQKMMDDANVAGVLLSETGNVTAIALEIDDSEDAYNVRQQILDDLNDVLKPYRATYDFRLSGIPFFRNTYVNLLNNEILFFVSISSILILLVLYFLYRSITGLVLPIIIVWLTVLYTVAFVVMTGGFFEILSSTIAPILLCVGIADSIHMISKYDDAMRQGLSKRNAIIEMLMTLGSATLLTSLTTAIGFATLFSSNVTPMKRFGIYTAVGVLLAYLITIFLLPSSLTLLPVKTILKTQKSKFYTWFELKLRQLDAFNRRYYKAIIVVGGFLCVIAVFGASQVTINSRVFDDIGRDAQVIKDSEYLSNKLTPPFPMEFVIDTKQNDGIKNPELLQKIADFKTYLLTFKPIQQVTTINAVLRELHQNLAEASTKATSEEESNELPQNRQLIAQYLLLLEFNNSDLLSEYVDFDYQKTRVSARMFDEGSQTTNNIRAKVKDYLETHFTEEEVTITGTTILVADLTDNIVYSLTASILLAFLGISIIMALLFKNVKLVIISLIPNIMPLLLTAGVMGFLSIYIKPSTAVIFTIAFGIAVDDSIHYLARFRVESKRGAGMVEALRKSTLKTGKAIIITSIILITGFGTLAFSQFDSTMLMGLLICLTIGSALMADLIYLPALFYWLKPELSYQTEKSSPHVEGSSAEVEGELPAEVR